MPSMDCHLSSTSRALKRNTAAARIEASKFRGPNTSEDLVYSIYEGVVFLDQVEENAASKRCGP